MIVSTMDLHALGRLLIEDVTVACNVVLQEGYYSRSVIKSGGRGGGIYSMKYGLWNYKPFRL